MVDETLRNSPFKPFLGSDPVPSNLDLTDLRLFLEEPLVELKALDEEVEQSRRKLQSLVERRNKLFEVAEKHQHVCHPIRRIPHEILQEVFLLCLDPLPLWPVLDANDAPLSLTRVSRGWRSVALNTPQLWDRLRIVIPFGKEAFIQRLMDQVRRWFGAAGARPLTISLYESEDTKHTSYKIVQDSILEYANRIKSLDLFLSDNILTGLSNTIMYSSWTVLERVTLTGWDYGVLNVPDLMLWKAPLLKSIEWVSVDNDFWKLPLQWAAMEEIRIMVPFGQDGALLEWMTLSASEARAMLHATPGLRTLQIPLSHNPTPRPLSDFPGGSGLVLQTPLILPFLTTLELVDTNLNPVLEREIFLDDLQLPALVTLRYTLRTSATDFEDDFDNDDSFYAPVPSTDAHPLVRFLRNQKSPVLIRVFKIHTASIKREGLLECLKMMPLLERFWLQDTDELGYASSSWMTEESGTILDGSFLTKLLPQAFTDGPGSEDETGAGHCLCPSLASLRLDCINCEVEDVEEFVVGRTKESNHRLERDTPTSFGRLVPLRRLSLGIIPTRNLDSEETRTKLKEKFAEIDVSADIKVLAIRGPAAEASTRSSKYYNPHLGQREYMLELQSRSVALHNLTRPR